MLRRRKVACPMCGSADVVPIVYGFPLPETEAEAEKGLIELGGCCVGDRDPRKACRTCGERFDRPPAHKKRRTRAKKGARSEP